MRLYRLAWVVLLAFGAEPVDMAWFPHPPVEVSSMALFDEAHRVTHKEEGGYKPPVSDGSDSGGETYRGVSRNNFPDWPGWAIVDGYKTQAGFPKNLDVDTRLQGLVRDFYQDWWESNRYGDIESQKVATRLFSFSINMNGPAGKSMAERLLQRAVRASTGQKIDDDGQIGPESLAAINSAPEDSLLAAFRSEAAGYYRLLAAVNPRLKVNENGWLNRAYRWED